jgi:ribosomal protein S18 acetylase RimI-like enzyme
MNPSLNVHIRHVTAADIPALTGLKPPEALHKDRLRDANENFLYLGCFLDELLVGFGLLVFVRPPTWPNAHDTTLLPALVDLNVSPAYRSRGLGSALIKHMVELVRARGNSAVYLGVDPVENPRAKELYLKLGFQPMSEVPHRSHWRFTDSAGLVHEGNEWSVDMVKHL